MASLGRGSVMASLIWLKPQSCSLPIFRRQTSLRAFDHSCRFARTGGFLSFGNRFGSRPMAMAAPAQAKRELALKEDEVASPADLQFARPLKIVEYPDPILRAKNKRIVTFENNLKKLVDEMFDVMYRTDGIGLSAPQVGINIQLMVMLLNPVGEHGGEEIVLVNPRVDKYSKNTVLFNEGCLSFPGIYGDVERPKSVKIDARDLTGARFLVNLSGLPARVFQHEFDHLQGVLFTDRMTDETLETIRVELQALEKKYEHKTGSANPKGRETHNRRKDASGFGNSKYIL